MHLKKILDVECENFIGYIPDSEIMSPNELSHKVVIIQWVKLASLLQPDGSIEL